MSEDLKKAVTMLDSGNYTCVLCKGGTTYTSTERGVKPLLAWLDRKMDLRGFFAADKVVGKGAAFLYVLLGVEEVYAQVMSELAADVFSAHGIQASCAVLVPGISNRSKTGPCPMEDAVRDIDEPEQALEALRKRLQEMAGK